MKLQELIKELNDLELVQTSNDFEEEIPQEYEKYFENFVASEIDVYKYRMPKISTTVFKFGENEYFGVEVISDIIIDNNSTISEYEKINHKLKFFEMKEIKTVTYTKK